MGYYVKLEACDVWWKDDAAKAAALAHVQAEMLSDAALLKYARGGTSPRKNPRDVPSYKWYSWTDTAKLRAATSIGEILGQFFDTYEDRGEDGWYVEFDSKSGQEEHLMRELAPFIRFDSTMEWSGEGGEHFRWLFDGTRMTVQQGTIEWR